MLINKSADYPMADEDEALNDALLHPPDSVQSTLLHAPSPPKQMVIFCPLPGQVRHLKWWLTNLFADNLDIFYPFPEVGNKEYTEMQLKFQDLPNPTVFVTTVTLGGTGLNLTTANHAVITRKFWVLNALLQAIARVVRLGQNSVPHTWLLNT